MATITQMPPKPLPSDLVRALNTVRDAARPVALELALSMIAERIARDLAEAYQVEAGVVPASWADLPEHVTHRMRWLAERAIRSLDPDHRLQAVEAATVDLEKWLARHTDPTPGEIAACVIGRFETHLQAVRS